MFYSVRNIRNSTIVYAGPNEALAAVALEPGTCYGKGVTQQIADQYSLAWREIFADDSSRVTPTQPERART